MKNWHKWSLVILSSALCGVIETSTDTGAHLADYLRHAIFACLPAILGLRMTLEKELGIAAKDYVYDWLAATDSVFIKTIKDGSGKYGRILGYVYSDQSMRNCLNDDIIDSGHGEPYYGGKRSA